MKGLYHTVLTDCKLFYDTWTHSLLSSVIIHTSFLSSLQLLSYFCCDTMSFCWHGEDRSLSFFLCDLVKMFPGNIFPATWKGTWCTCPVRVLRNHLLHLSFPFHSHVFALFQILSVAGSQSLLTAHAFKNLKIPIEVVENIWMFCSKACQG